jgi:hypothetical protein
MDTKAYCAKTSSAFSILSVEYANRIMCYPNVIHVWDTLNPYVQENAPKTTKSQYGWQMFIRFNCGLVLDNEKSKDGRLIQEWKWTTATSEYVSRLDKDMDTTSTDLEEHYTLRLRLLIEYSQPEINSFCVESMVFYIFE